MTSRVEVSQSSDFGITRFQLAGGKAGQGLPKYQVENTSSAEQLSTASESSRCTCNRIVIGLIALMAAGGSIALFALSGGPNNLTLFAPAVALGAGATVVTIWLIVVLVCSHKESHASQAELLERESVSVEPTNDTILLEMQSPEVTAEQVHSALAAFQPEQRQRYFEWVSDRYFGEGRAPLELEEDQKKVLSTFAQFPGTLAELNLEKAHPEFARQMLTHIDPKIIGVRDKQLRQPGKNLLERLFAKAGPPKSVEEFKIFARHPHVLVFLTQQTHAVEPSKEIIPLFPPPLIAAIYGQMDDTQKTEFLRGMRYVAYRERVPFKYSILSKALWECISQTLNKEFAEKFLPARLNQENPSEELKVQFAQERALLVEIAQWPTMVAYRIYFTEDTRIGDAALINALDGVMRHGERDEFITFAAAQFEEQLALGVAVVTPYMNACMAEDVSIPRLTRLVFVRSPSLMAQTVQSLSDKGADFVQGIVTVMLRPDRIVFLKKTSEVDRQNFRERMTFLLLKAKENRARINDSLAVAYFRKYPEDFRDLVLTNEKLGSDLERGTFSLDLLEQMREHAEAIIQKIDDGSYFGYPYFNFLTNLLVDEVSALRPESPPMSPLRELLIARFKFCIKMKETRSKWVAAFGNGVKIWNLKPEGREWDRFNQIAGPWEHSVWKKSN